MVVTLYLKSPKPFPSALPPAVIAPPNVLSCPKLMLDIVTVHYYHLHLAGNNYLLLLCSNAHA